MTFTKFLSLLEKRALFFCRADKIGDPFEGSYPIGNIMKRLGKASSSSPASPDLPVAFLEIRKFILLNCWNLGADESAALWKLYAKDNEGVAIQTTFRRLKASFGSEGTGAVFIGKVNYINFLIESFEEQNCFFTPFLHKMKSFEYEHEVRAISAIYPEDIQDGSDVRLLSAPAVFETGTFVDVDLNALIENVYVAPTAEEWFRDLMESAIKRFDLNLTPHWTDMHGTPLF
ncbi:MAG: DUF2971 domain-containing protein [Candidatus Bathyarchaeia archaeon]